MTVTLIDHGAGNVASVERAFARLGASTQRASTGNDISRATAILLPGVGHFAALIRALDEKDLRPALLDAIARRVPFLGICLGLQALYESSAEAPGLRGLGTLQGDVTALPPREKLPHMGWNRVRPLNTARLFAGIAPNSYFYFAHSFAAPLSVDATAVCHYGSDFAAAIERDNLFAVQFHPEKSGTAGAMLLRNFLDIAA